MKYIHNNLGVILKNGNRSVPKTTPLAIEYFETAIKQYNDIFALFNLSRMYFYGEGVPINIDKATTLFSQLDASNFDINKLLDYLGQYPTKFAQISNEILNNLDMAHILPGSWKHVFPPNCLDSIDFIYTFDEFLPINELLETTISKQLKSQPIITAFYGGLT